MTSRLADRSPFQAQCGPSTGSQRCGMWRSIDHASSERPGTSTTLAVGALCNQLIWYQGLDGRCPTQRNAFVVNHVSAPLQESAMHGLDALPCLPWQVLNDEGACHGETDRDVDLREAEYRRRWQSDERIGPVHRCGSIGCPDPLLRFAHRWGWRVRHRRRLVGADWGTGWTGVVVIRGRREGESQTLHPGQRQPGQ